MRLSLARLRRGGGEVWRFAVARGSLRLRQGGWGSAVGGYDARVRRQVPGGPQPPLAFSEYVPITTAVTLRGARPVDRNEPLPEAVFSQLGSKARGSEETLTNPMDTRNPSRTMLDIPSRVRVHVETLLAAQNDMGVCDAFQQYAPV
ncbi:hypothetical protein GCM10010260_42730 [Streptomyces filipinensis]|uniref:Uncharacterized protein n=1 Tax=Streptomyces filipinensis TaxID=66887 RepID=A0A918ICU5_9ACTN|nr:hypothetical protein GCM10010260_42730 [Streptomyces filipinensis]